MGKKLPNLQVVTKESRLGSSADGGDLSFLDIVNYSQLGPAEKRKVDRIVQMTAPGSEIIGAAVPGRAYDVRPVIVAAEAKDNALSLIRFFGPEAALVVGLSEKVNQFLKNFEASSPLLPTVMIRQGVLDGQLWYRRALIPETLNQHLAHTTQLTFSEALNIAESLIEVVLSWHQSNLLHGHLTTSNVFVTPSGEVGLIDPLIALAVVQASASLEMEDLAKGYEVGSFAPEAFKTTWPDQAVDIYGVGKVFWEVFSRVQRGESATSKPVMTADNLRTIRQVILQMTAENPRQRPELSDVLSALRSLRGGESGNRRIATDQVSPTSSGPSSEMIDTRKQTTEFRRGEVLAVDRSNQDSNVTERNKNGPRPGTVPGGKFAVKSRIVRQPVAGSAGIQETFEQVEVGSTERPVMGGAEIERTGQRSDSGPDQPRESVTRKEPPRGEISSSSSKGVNQKKHHEISEVFFAADEVAEQLEQAVTKPSSPPKHLEPFDRPAERSSSNGKKTAQPAEVLSDLVDDYDASAFAQSFFKDDQAVETSSIFEEQSITPAESELETETFLDESPRSSFDVSSLSKFKVPAIVFGAIVALVFLFSKSGSYDEDLNSESDIVAAWKSSILSDMSRVAELAVDPNQPNSRLARRVIITSVYEGDKAARELGAGQTLLKIAFDNRWEKKLSDTDQQQALLMGLSRLLDGKQQEQNKVALDQLNPGVILALAATAGEGGAAALNEVPAKVLTLLPAPLNLGFSALVGDNPQLGVGDSGVRTFAQFSVGDGVDAERLFKFLQTDTDRRLIALASLTSQDATLAGKYLEVILNHPNLPFDGETVRWARDKNVSLLNWKEVDNCDLFFILAGIKPGQPLELKHVVALLMHPVADIRGYAISQTLDRIKLHHPGAVPILQNLREQPNELTPLQTYTLAMILQNPSKVSAELVRQWVTSGLPLPLLEVMLASTATEPAGTRVDFEIARFLQTADWSPDLKTLKILAFHPEKLPRILAYSKLFAFPDQVTAKEILVAALDRETDEKFRSQIEQMLGVIGK